MEILVTSTTDVKKAAHSRPHQFVEHLSKKHDVTVLCMNAWWLVKQNGMKLYEHHYNQKVKIGYLTMRRVSPVIQEISSIKTLNSLPKVLKHHSFDVYINFDSVISGYVITKNIKRRGIPTIFDIDDDIPEMIRTSTKVPYLLRTFGGFVGGLMLKRIIKSADKITFTTDSLKFFYNIPKNKSELIPNGVDTQLFGNYPSEQLREKLGIDQDFIIGYAGVLREWVDLEPVFSTIKDIDVSIKLLIVGEEGGFEENKNLVKRYGISDKVLFTGTVPYTQVPRYISCMDACLIPFNISAVTENALPLKLFEYMACEKPVISTPLAGVKEAVGNRVLYASNAEELKQRILELYHNNELRKELGKDGRRFVERNYSWDKICKKFEKVLIEACEE